MPLSPALKRKVRNALHKLTILIQFNRNIQLKYRDIQPVEFRETTGNERELQKLLNNSLEQNVNTNLYYKERRINPIERKRSRIPWYIFKEESKIKLLWDTYILILLLYLTWTIPSELVFDTENTLANIIIEFGIDICFILDVVVNFFSSFEERGVIQHSLQTIAHHYIRGNFAFDFICSFPLNWILIGVDLSSVTQIVVIKQLLRLVRIFKI